MSDPEAEASLKCLRRDTKCDWGRMNRGTSLGERELEASRRYQWRRQWNTGDLGFYC